MNIIKFRIKNKCIFVTLILVVNILINDFLGRMKYNVTILQCVIDVV